MQLDDLIALVDSEPERTVSQVVRTAPPELLAKAAKPGGMLMTDFVSASGRRDERRDVCYRHILGPPASPEAIDAWLERAPYALPPALLAMVKRVNGMRARLCR